MMKKERPMALFIFVQGMGICAMLLCAAVMGWGGAALIRAWPSAGQGLGLTTVLCGAGVGGCLLWLLGEFVLMCGRVRRETAFTVRNVRALGRMALALALGGGLLIPVGPALMRWLLMGMRGLDSPVWAALPCFVAWAAALMVRGIQVLMRRAAEMQTEADLTV